MIFRQLFDVRSFTYTYLLADPESRDAVLIDPVFEQVPRDTALIEELSLKLLMTLETHVHADHITGAWLLRESLGSKIALSAKCEAEGVDVGLGHGARVVFGRRSLEVRETPGHTSGCLTYVLDDKSMAFTGDCLLIRGAGRTDFQQGDARRMYRSIHEQIFTLPDECLLWPGHDYNGRTVTTTGEERRLNPRLGGELSEDDFVGYMNNLGLAHPRQIDVALPANLKCGRPAEGSGKEQRWAPLAYTFAGVWEIGPQWLEENGHEVQIVDVRRPEEFAGDLGHIRGAISIPLDDLQSRAGELSKDKPVVTVCRAGGRSAQATVLLARVGFDKVANLAGGMIRWRSQGLAVVEGKA